MTYFVTATIVGAFWSKPILRLSLRWMRPVAHDTPLHGIIGTVAFLQLLSYSLPAAASILGLGAYNVMGEATVHYGDVVVLRNTYFVLMYNFVFVAASAVRVRLALYLAPPTTSPCDACWGSTLCFDRRCEPSMATESKHLPC